MKHLRIISNFPALGNIEYNKVMTTHRLYPETGNRLLRVLRVFFAMRHNDYIIFNMLHSDLYLLACLSYFLPIKRCKIIVVDLILPIPVSFGMRIKARLRALLFRKVYKFLHYAKNVSGFEKYYAIEKAKFTYIPFKVNNIDAIKKLTPHDNGYIFVGGQTRRDFKTFFEAVKDLNYPIKVVAPSNTVLHLHGSRIDVSNPPDNIELITDAITPDTFTRQIAGAKLVVIPIVKENISPSGIGVYLQCMALKKCVIISAGPSVDDILENEVHALIVPPEDAQALRKAIIRAFEDSALRNRLAENGYQYSKKLGDESRLLYSIIEILLKDKFI